MMGGKSLNDTKQDLIEQYPGERRANRTQDGRIFLPENRLALWTEGGARTHTHQTSSASTLPKEANNATPMLTRTLAFGRLGMGGYGNARLASNTYKKQWARSQALQICFKMLPPADKALIFENLRTRTPKTS
jgi:hypothetical protein